MRLTYISFFIIFVSIVLPFNRAFSATSISFNPNYPIQGEPVMITIDGLKLSEISKATFGGKILRLFIYKNKPTALLGVDIHKAPGDYEVAVIPKIGATTTKILTIKERPKIEETFSIPEKLGGDTTESQKALVTSLQQENLALAKIPTGSKIFWLDKFVFPLKTPIVSDPFGYSRKTGGYVLNHKGTDFKAKEGTQVFAMNDGIVRVVDETRNYGKMIVVDHGLGVQSFYLHLSKILIKKGQFVTRGQNIALSGQTGYASGPHLHLSIRIYNVSIDPMKFMALFK